MRLPADGRPAHIVRLAGALIAALGLAACASSAARLPGTAAQARGPEADYPVVVGEAYDVDGTTYTPEDVLNYDEVGYLAADGAGGDGVSGAHHTLPLPSYVEATSLETGRTILVRLERRGPLDGHDLLALSPGAIAQLGAGQGDPIRVRRVNPPEDQRALLRSGDQAALRMDTPMSLVEILKRRLPARDVPAVEALASGLTPAAAPASSAVPAPSLPRLEAQETPSARSAPPEVAAAGGFLVQVAAFSTADRARNAAETLDGAVSPSGRYFRVRTGPFATRGEAEASLAKVRAAGYTDARILTNG